MLALLFSISLFFGDSSQALTLLNKHFLSLPILTVEAEKGDKSAQFLLAQRYAKKGKEFDIKKARSWLVTSGRYRFPLALLYLGLAYNPEFHDLLDSSVILETNPIPEKERSYEESLHWFRQLAEHGGEDLKEIGQYFSGFILTSGEGIEDGISANNDREAFEFFKEGAKTNAPMLLKGLALMYYSGLGTEENLQEYRRLLEQIADKSIWARERLIEHYLSGTAGFEQDLERAASLVQALYNAPNEISVYETNDFELKAKGDHIFIVSHETFVTQALTFVYESEIPKNLQDLIHYYETLALLLGMPDMSYKLGQLYFHGIPTKDGKIVNVQKAFAWLNFAERSFTEGNSPEEIDTSEITIKEVSDLKNQVRERFKLMSKGLEANESLALEMAKRMEEASSSFQCQKAFN